VDSVTFRERPAAAFSKLGLDEAPPPSEALVHLMNRTSFGIREAELTSARSMGYARWVELQLNPEPLDVAPLENTLAGVFPTLALSNGQLLRDYAPGSMTDFVPLGELRAATMARQIYSPRQLFEVMVEFWNNHFSVEHTDGPVRQFKTTDDRAMRQHALGKFSELLNANARSPAMLYYLDNFANVRTGPNENYARELMELHTLGVNGGYTEADVRDVARAFTGWTYTRASNFDFAFVLTNHDSGPKQVLGTTLPAGRGIEDGQDVLNLLANHPSTMRHVSTKLVQRFVSDQPPASLVDKVAETWRISGGDIRALLRTIFFSKEFLMAQDQKVKRPAEFLISALRATDATVEGQTWPRSFGNVLDTLGQLPFMWPAPNGYPDVAAYWVNTNGLLNRWNYITAMLEGRLDRGIRVNLASLIGNARSPEQLVQQLAQRVLRRALTGADQAVAEQLAAAGGDVRSPLAATDLNARALEALALLLCSPYFQYR
jgi:uncharacterized protein (DUF1800 family)